MNKQEAIQQLKAMTPILLRSSDCTTEMAKAQEMAISALKKQIPKKPKVMETTLVGEKFWWYCGHCGASRHTGSKANYCGYCGGKVDWGNEDE